MLASKSIRLADVYSFTTDRAWINHEWLAELLTGIGYASLGALGLNLLKVGVVFVVAAVAWTIRETGAGASDGA
jgi:hypothetical protein